MDVEALPLSRGSAVDLPQLRRQSAFVPPHQSTSATSLSHRNRRSLDHDLFVRRVSSYQNASQPLYAYSDRSRSYDTEGGPQLPAQWPLIGIGNQYDTSDDRTYHMKKSYREYASDAVVNLTSGIVAFLLSSTLAVSCASVLVGHTAPLSDYISHFIDINLLGTAVLCVVLAWQSCAPWTLGAIDVFVVPIMAQMGVKITKALDGDMNLVVPTTIVMVAFTSCLLGFIFFTMGFLRVTSIANYMPYPVIAGFLSGIGVELIKNGLHMASSKAFTLEIFTLHEFSLLFPAIAFASFARVGRYFHVPVAFSFPCLLVLSLASFHVVAAIGGYSLSDLHDARWIFKWSPQVIQETPLWFAWLHVDFSKVQWSVLTDECSGYIVSLILLGALKYSVATTSLSTLFGREISPDHEMRVIGLANMASGLLGCCGGCHYLSAMGIMQQFEAHERMPALVCAALQVLLWSQGIKTLEYVPKFVFGGLILSVGVHFLEAYFVTPFRFLKKFERGIVVLITVSFLIVGMLESVALGILISMMELIYRIHDVGCVHHESTGALARSAVDRTQEQIEFLDANGSAIFLLRLQGYLFFGTSVSLLERVETRVQSLNFPKLQYLIIDFGLVPSFDATALLHFRKVGTIADLYVFDVYFCGLNDRLTGALNRNQYSSRVHFLRRNVDEALEVCENLLLPDDLVYHSIGSIDEWERRSPLELWEHFLHLQQKQSKKLLPLAAHLTVQVVRDGMLLADSSYLRDTFFICFGDLNVLVDSEFSGGNIPGILSETNEEEPMSIISRAGRALSVSIKDERQWTPFSTEPTRVRKIGPGSIVTPGVTTERVKYVATSDCLLLRLTAQAMDELEGKAPQTAMAVLKLVHSQLSSHFLHANKRVSDLSSLLYK